VYAAAAENGQIDALLKQLEQVHDFSGVSVSPDGKWVTWTQAVPGSSANTEIYVLDRTNPSAKPQRLSAGDGSQSFEESEVSWSPDSTEIAFLSNAESAQKQLFVISAKGGKARKLTDLHGYATDVRWSPDGKQIALLYAENGGGGGPLQAAPAQTGVIEADIHNQRIAVLNAEGGELAQLSPADLNVYEYDWSPDGSRFAAIAAPGPADNNWWSAQLYVLDIAAKRLQSLYRPPKDQQLALPRWSPDGKQIAFIGGIMSDAGFTGGDIFTVAGNGGAPRNVTPNRAASPNGIQWQGPGEIVFTEALNGGGAISTLNLATGQTETLWKGDQNLHQDGNYPNFYLARDGRTSALIRNTWEHSPDIWAGRIGEWQQITHQNADQKPHWGKAESLMWTNEGLRAQGWLLYPENYDPSKRYPMIVQIHGGPAGLKSAAWPSPRFDMSVMAGLGYFVFFPNPRGSYGEGEAFTKANVKDFGGGDLRDILAGVDAVVKKVSVDNQRIGVTGWSYGGYMTMWTVTQTNRFRAAVSGAGIANWQSYYGENLIDKWMIPFFGASVYDDPAVYAKSSPITFIKQVKTPTLVVVGERDAECPSPQSFEFWHALKTLGVRTELVVYPGEGHAFHEPKNRSDVLRRTLAWFDEYLGSGQEQSKAKAN
jgi:dipeptidyl aminopeptidase/acylaminoacyl peptidase